MWCKYTVGAQDKFLFEGIGIPLGKTDKYLEIPAAIEMPVFQAKPINLGICRLGTT